MERTYIKDLKNFVGKEVSISGWIDIRRDQGKMVFFDFRDVSGKVQGVWFRDSTKKEACTLKLTGWVKNRTDGRVEVMACGDETSLKSLYQWLCKGPILAKVENVVEETLSFQNYQDFQILKTSDE